MKNKGGEKSNVPQSNEKNVKSSNVFSAVDIFIMFVFTSIVSFV